MYTLKHTQIICLLFVYGATGVISGKPCLSRKIKGESVVCVCNQYYCDDITRVAPEKDTYVAYTSSKAGSRFKVSVGRLNQLTNDTGCEFTLKLDPNTKFQTILGFGGAVTDSASINWKSLSQPLQQELVNSYFSKNGLEYNFLRVPIGGADFSTHQYAYNSFPVDDINLSNFSLAYEDIYYKIPMIKAIYSAASSDVRLFASTWSPPNWMKTIVNGTRRQTLKKKYYDTYAEYHLKFLKEYLRRGVKVWGISTTNEPVNAVGDLVSFNSLGWYPDDMAKWVINNLGPKIRNSAFRDLKIFALDDNRKFLLPWLDKMLSDYPQALDYIDGIAVHYYADKEVPDSAVEYMTNKYPNKPILSTEACEGTFPHEKKVVIGSWLRADTYISDIINDLNLNIVGWIDWNLCLNAQGGPNWAKNFVDSPIIVFPESNEFIKQPMFYAMGHVAKFLPRGSIRISGVGSNNTSPESDATSLLQHVSFITTLDTIAVILYNKGDKINIKIKLGTKEALIEMEGSSITTVELPYINSIN